MRNIVVNGKVIGQIDDQKKILYKRVKKSVHFFRVLNSWGVDNEVLETLPDDFRIMIYETEEKKIYTTTVKDFREKGKFYHFKNQIDHKLQKFLPLTDWKVTQDLLG